MSNFSEKLDEYIRESEISVQKLALLSGVDRSHLQKMKKGERVPNDETIISKISSALMLNATQAAELKRLYLIAKIGDETYARHMLVKSFFEEIGKKPKTDAIQLTVEHNYHLNELPESYVVSGKHDVTAILKAVIETEAFKPHGEIKLVAQPSTPLLMELLILAANSNLEINHIICFHKGLKANSGNKYNITFLKSIMPLLTSECSYNPMYYYNDVDVQFGPSSLLPYIIVTSEYAVNFSSDMQYALFFHSQDAVKLFVENYQRLANLSSPVVEKLVNPLSFISTYAESNLPPDILAYGTAPCFGFFYTDELIGKYAKQDLPYREQVLQAYSEIVNLYSNSIAANLRLTSFFSPQGLDEFLSTGRVGEIPDEFYDPFDTQDRYLLLSTLRRYMSDGQYTPVMVNPSKFQAPQNLYMSALSERKIILMCSHSNLGFVTFNVLEESIAYSIYNFLEYLKGSDLVYSREYTEEFIIKELNNLKEKIS